MLQNSLVTVGIISQRFYQRVYLREQQPFSLVARVIEQPLLMLFDRVATKPCPVVARLLENFSAVRLFPTHVCRHQTDSGLSGKPD